MNCPLHNLVSLKQEFRFSNLGVTRRQMKKGIKTVMYILDKCNYILIFLIGLSGDFSWGFFCKAGNKKLANLKWNNQMEWKEFIKQTENKFVLSKLGHLHDAECLLWNKPQQSQCHQVYLFFYSTRQIRESISI